MLRMTIALAALWLLIFAAPSMSDEIQLNDSITRLETELVAKHGEAARARLQKGLAQMKAYWKAEDGDASAFEDFVRKNFIADTATLDATFGRLESALEQYDGHMLEIIRVFRENSDLDRGPLLSVDE